MTGSDWGWWRDRRPPATRLHLDTAAAGRSSRAILAAAAAHAEREAETGGYDARRPPPQPGGWNIDPVTVGWMEHRPGPRPR